MTPVYGQMPSREFTRALHVAIQCGWPPRIIAREPDSGSGSRDLHAGQGVRPHGRRGACGLMFVMVGSETTTSPRVVMPNRYCAQQYLFEPACRDAEQILLGARRVERHAQRPDDRVA